MTEYELKFDEEFTKSVQKMDNSIRKMIVKKIQKLKENPRSGKVISPILYELYCQSYRIYYTIDDSQVKVLLIAIEHKDQQQEFINKANDKKFIKELIKKNL